MNQDQSQPSPGAPEQPPPEPGLRLLRLHFPGTRGSLHQYDGNVQGQQLLPFFSISSEALPRAWTIAAWLFAAFCEFAVGSRRRMTPAVCWPGLSGSFCHSDGRCGGPVSEMSKPALLRVDPKLNSLVRSTCFCTCVRREALHAGHNCALPGQSQSSLATFSTT